MQVDPRDICPNCEETQDEDPEGKIWYGCTKLHCRQWYHADCLAADVAQAAADADAADADIKKLRKQKKKASEQLKKRARWWCPMCVVVKKIKMK